MILKHKSFTILYFFIVIVNTYALVSESQLLKMAAIPFVGISLILYLIFKTRLEQRFQKLIFAGLVLSMAGDIQLLFSSGSQFYFLTAMVATILAYILYAMAYSIDFNKNFSVTKKIITPLVATLCVSVFTLYISAPDNFAEILFLVVAYFLALSVMAILSGYRYKSVNRKSFRIIMAGSVAFLISDLSIGYFYFVEQENIMMVTYLIAYLLAQYLVVLGTIERKTIIN